MILTALIAGVLTALGFVFLAMKFGNGPIRLMLGYAWATDLTITAACLWLFALSGTISGMLTGIMTGLTASLILSLARNILGYRKVIRNGSRFHTIDTPGRWTAFVQKATRDFAQGTGPREDTAKRHAA